MNEATDDAVCRPRRTRIALIVNFLDSAYQMSLREAIGRAAARRGVDLWVAIGRELEHEDPSERALNVIYRWLGPNAVDGAIVVAGALSNFVGSEGVASLCRSLAPLHTCSIGSALGGIASIVIDNRAAMRSLVDHLIEQHACRRIAYIGGPSHNAESRERLAGYREALAAARLPWDGSLTAVGHFSLPTGRDAMIEILGRSRELDAVVAANDYMAIGALEELARRGVRVPEDVLVMGFDDAPVARFAKRSLSTVAQPIDEMAERALDSILSSLSGIAPPPVTCLDAQLVLRESCGCGYVVSHSSRRADARATGSAADYLREHEQELVSEVLEAAGTSRPFWESFSSEMVQALADELAGRSGEFLRAIERIAERSTDRETSLDELGRALLALRRSCRNAGYHGSEHMALEETCMRGVTALSSAAIRRDGRRALNVMDRAYGSRQVSQRLSVALNHSGLSRNFGQVIPNMGVTTGFLAVLPPRASAAAPARLTPLAAIERGQPVPVEPDPYPAEQLFPAGFPSGQAPGCLLLLPLTFERDVLGLVAFGGEADPFVCEVVRSQLSAALQLGALHGRVVEETALRERLARDQLLGELAVARRIQSALIPKLPSVPGLDMAAGLAVADQVGGDYYDVFPTPDGGWIAIGDVTGHGLLAGMIMLMMQSAVSALVNALPEATPAEIVARLNRVMRRNIRERLGEAEHATFLMLRYREGGHVTLAGAHEEALIYRVRERRCERVASSGIWLGITEDVGPRTLDHSVQLEVGDVLVLYTDGLIEARTEAGEELGLERVERILIQSGALPVTSIHDRLFAAVRAWAPLQQDDITLIVARRVH